MTLPMRAVAGLVAPALDRRRGSPRRRAASVSRPSVNAWTTRSGDAELGGEADQRREVRRARVHAAVADSPIRCTRSAPRIASRSTSFSASEPSRDRLVDARQVLLDDRAGAEVEVADLAVAHLPLGQPDGRARRRSAACAGSAPRGRRRPACRRARPRCPGPGGASPQPSRTTRQPRRPAGRARAVTASRRGVDDRGERLRRRATRRRRARRRRRAARAARRRCRA